MKAAAMSVWVFINLLFFGMCGYLYLIWSQYWMYIEKQRLFNNDSPETPRKTSLTFYDKYTDKYSKPPFNTSVFVSKNRRSAVGAIWSSNVLALNSKGSQLPSTNAIIRRIHGSPRFPNIHKPLLEFDSDKYVCDDPSASDCEAKTKEFKELLLKEFHRVLMGEGKVFRSGLDSQNIYDVKYEGIKEKLSTRDDIMCALKRVAVNTVTTKDEPFKTLGFNIPEAPLQEAKAFNTCAVVASAGTLLGSRLGEFIDSHDMVLRFNNAPTDNYTDDVGSKTTFRILNSQVVTKPEFKFLEDSLYKDISVLIWDPSNYSSTLDEWYHHPDYPLFPVYKRLLEQRPGADTHILYPQVLWDLWAVLQDTSPYRLRRNPPSSGFLGLWFSLHRCKHVRVVEYVPSSRASRRCHYYVPRDDTACTLGAWHPLAQEKALAEKLRENTDVEVFQRGFIDIPGFISFSTCIQESGNRVDAAENWRPCEMHRQKMMNVDLRAVAGRKTNDGDDDADTNSNRMPCNTSNTFT